MALPTLIDAIGSLPAFARVLNTVPAPGQRLTIGGLAGSSDAVSLAALVQRLQTRFFVVVAEGVPQAERWLADLQAILDETPVALYPSREGFGEAEPHAEIAGERVETLERVSRGEVRILLTAARAILERTRLPTTLRSARLELRKGDVRRPEEIAEHLERVGFERVPMVDDVAQFSVRGGIFDIYSFGMADPVRSSSGAMRSSSSGTSTCTASARPARQTSRSSSPSMVMCLTRNPTSSSGCRFLRSGPGDDRRPAE